MGRVFDELVAEADAAWVDGWDFSWLHGRATEERPSWGYVRLMAGRMARARVALDIQTGGGEVLATAPRLPPVTVATEGWPPNLLARRHGSVREASPSSPTGGNPAPIRRGRVRSGREPAPGARLVG